MANLIATQADAYNVGGTKPSGYSASKCCTNAMAISCGCTDPGYASKRLVPVSSLSVATQYCALSINIAPGENAEYYYCTVLVINLDDGTKYFDGILGKMYNNSQADSTTEIQSIPKNSNIAVSVQSPYVYRGTIGYETGWLSFDTTPENASLEDNETDLYCEFTITDDTQCDAYVNGY